MSVTRQARQDRRDTGRGVIALRCVAGAIDVAVLAAAFLAIASAQGGLDTTNGFQAHVDGAGAIFWFAGAFAYYFLTEALLDRTPGKALVGLRVVRASDGGRPTPWAIAGRTLLRVVDVLPVFYGLGLLVILVNPSRQRIGDLGAGTLVVAD